MNIPCNKPPSLCEAEPNPVTSYSAEAKDSQTFIGLAWGNEVPRLGKHFEVYPCFRITESIVSQEDADLAAQRLVVDCSNPCVQSFTNLPQTAVSYCPDGSPFSYTVAAGLFAGASQHVADELAMAFAEKSALLHRVCLSSLPPLEICLGALFSNQIVATGKDVPFGFFVVAGALPPGITQEQIGAATLVLSGVPTTPGFYAFTIEVQTSVGSFMRKDFFIQVVGITSEIFPDATVGTFYSETLTSDGFGFQTITWSISSGTLPDGLSIDSSTGVISGTPTTGGTDSFTVSVTDGNSVCQKEMSLAVNTVPGNICTDGFDIPLSKIYEIDGYLDGMISNNLGDVNVTDPIWDGTFSFTKLHGTTYYWIATDTSITRVRMDGHSICNAYLFWECVDDIPTFTMQMRSNSNGDLIWSGTKVGGGDPVGVYNNDGNGNDADPLTLTIKQGIGNSTTSVAGVAFCFLS